MNQRAPAAPAPVGELRLDYAQQYRNMPYIGVLTQAGGLQQVRPAYDGKSAANFAPRTAKMILTVISDDMRV